MSSDKKEIVLRAIDSHESFMNIWIGGSEVSCHYCNRDEGIDQVTISEMIKFGIEAK
jgi:hypothetical protein